MLGLSLVTLLSFAAPAAQQAEAAAPAVATASLSGTWSGTFRFPGAAQAQAFRVGWTVDARDEVYGGFVSDAGNALILGRYDRQAGLVRARFIREGSEGELVCDPAADPAPLTVTLGGQAVETTGARSADAMDADLDLLVATAIQRPMQVHRDGLPEYWREQIEKLIRTTMEADKIVGLSAAFIVDGEILDVRSFGWQDYRQRIPASHETMYRWASISKVVTGALAVKLISEGKLDPARDVREYVPEFPEKKHTVTVEDLLSHQAGIVHYQHGPIRTVADYEESDPFQDRVKALDMFKESPLLFEPRAQYSYSTHGFALAGAALERAGGKRYAALVDERIATPLGMDSFQPDFQPVEIPGRTRGYVRAAGGYVIDSGDSNVAWKLAGGGFISTIEDLARFGTGLLGDALLSDEEKALMCAERSTRDGEPTGYGLGIGIRELRGKPIWSHSGGQRKTATYMLLHPELRLGVCMMSNTENAPVGALSLQILELMLGEQ